jgi:hypothetical protein
MHGHIWLAQNFHYMLNKFFAIEACIFLMLCIFSGSYDIQSIPTMTNPMSNILSALIFKYSIACYTFHSQYCFVKMINTLLHITIHYNHSYSKLIILPQDQFNMHTCTLRKSLTINFGPQNIYNMSQNIYHLKFLFK